MNRSSNLFIELSTGLWHSTNIANYRQMLLDGAIKPNIDRPMVYGDYCCRKHRAVCLFDYERPTPAQLEENISKWSYAQLGPVTILMRFSREKSAANLIYYPDMKQDESGNVVPGTIIPHIEVCHKGEISLSLVEKYILVSRGERKFYVENELTEERLLEVSAEFEVFAPEPKVVPIELTPEAKERLARTRQIIEEIKKRNR